MTYQHGRRTSGPLSLARAIMMEMHLRPIRLPPDCILLLRCPLKERRAPPPHDTNEIGDTTVEMSDKEGNLPVSLTPPL